MPRFWTGTSARLLSSGTSGGLWSLPAQGGIGAPRSTVMSPCTARWGDCQTVNRAVASGVASRSDGGDAGRPVARPAAHIWLAPSLLSARCGTRLVTPAGVVFLAQRGMAFRYYLIRIVGDYRLPSVGYHCGINAYSTQGRSSPLICLLVAGALAKSSSLFCRCDCTSYPGPQWRTVSAGLSVSLSLPVAPGIGDVGLRQTTPWKPSPPTALSDKQPV